MPGVLTRASLEELASMAMKSAAKRIAKASKNAVKTDPANTAREVWAR